MTDKEFKRLRRSELIEIIYEYQKREEALNEEIAALKGKLDDRELKIKDSGSIAEAVAKLNGLFETAQKTAEYYKDVIIPKMSEIRALVDRMEVLTGRNYWPYPTYADLLFGVR